MKDKIKRHLRKFPNPILLIDKDLNCVYCNRNNFCKVGTPLKKYFRKSFVPNDEAVEEEMMLFKKRSYCARISPFLENMFVCELFTSNTIIRMAENTDVYARVAPLIASADSNTEIAWKRLSEIESIFRNDLQADYIENVMNIERPIIEIRRALKNFSEYSQMCLNKSRNEVIDVREFILDLQKKINTELAPCDRFIDVIDTENMHCISACRRHLIVALMNAIQNAMWYSPKYSAPIVAFYKEREEETNRRMIVIQVVNDIISCAEDFEGHNFECAHSGLGIPIIKQFARDSDGEATMEIINGKYRLCIKIPENIQEISPIYGFGCPKTVKYTNEELEIISIVTNSINLTFRKV